MRLPRVPCPVCGRPIAVAPVEAIGLGAVVDHKQESRRLVLCPGSMRRVPLSWPQRPGGQDRPGGPRAVQQALFE
ncbi:hypothetical protein [Streptomyces sp. CB03911]|uniref:hypothetical protein n=1 Tax=Streptomyces sp. CB03911 TaxID=1804758 RepID=UPI0018FE34F4|nr:hypothetical protein [Streptomyces sp. CB03911]